jgi:signal transduction histidine kinase
VIRRFLLAQLALTLLVLVVLEVPLGWFFAGWERDRLYAAVERDAMALATLYEDTLDAGQPLDVRPAQRYATRTATRVVVVDGDGVSLVDTEGPSPRSFRTRDEIARGLRGEPVIGTRPSETLGSDLLYVVVPVASGGQVHGAVRVTLPTADVDHRITRFWLTLAALGGVSLAAVAVVSLALSRSVLRPVEALTEGARRLAGGRMDTRIEIDDAPAELQTLASTFNDMADRLAGSLRSQQAFVADASHQLRTPLTALRLRLDNAEAETTDAATRRDLRAGLEELDRMTDLVSQLLELTRFEGRRAPNEVVDLALLMHERAELWQAIADEKDVGLVVEPAVPARPLVACAVPGAVEQILDNLIDNALKASPAEGSIELVASRSGAIVELHVRDTGPGLDDLGKAQAFERFWRGSDRNPGTGLGLSIVKRLAEISGGSVRLDDRPGGGLDVVVRLPSADHPPGPSQERSPS